MTTTTDTLRTFPTSDAADAGAGERGRVLTRADAAAAITNVVTVAVMLLGLIGLINSFANVTEALRPAFGSLAWTATLGIDLGILVFSALGLVLAMLDLHIPWLRLVPWSLMLATIYLNVAPEDTWIGRIAHAVLPGLWVVAVEVGIHALRARAGLATGKRMDSIRFARWVLAPWRTLLLWRRMVLWEIRSYPDALARERARVLALTDLQQRYGRRWRRDAPKRTVALYRLGELVPADAIPAPPPTDTTAALPPARPAKPRKQGAQPRTAQRTGPRATGTRTVPADVTDLLPTGRRIAARLADQGRTLTRSTLLDELRADGHALSNAKAGHLLAHIRQHHTADQDDHGDRDEPLKEAS